MKNTIVIFSLSIVGSAYSQYSPPVGEAGSTAIHMDSSIIVGWVAQVISFDPGPQNISEITSPDVSFGVAPNASGHAEGNSTDVVSLGDGGSITLSFFYPIQNGLGPDFAVFENSFDDTFLEFAHVEVSTDGLTFIRIPSVSLVSSATQTTSFGSTDTELIHNLAGKFRQGYGTPFDLQDVVDSSGINLDSINFVRIVDVVGSVQSAYASWDADGDIINDPFPTEFESGGFDLDAIGVINVNGVFVAEMPNAEKVKLSIFPNPSSGKVVVKSAVEIDEIALFNLQGVCVYRTNTFVNDLDFSQLQIEQGAYILEISTANHERMRQILTYQD